MNQSELSRFVADLKSNEALRSEVEKVLSGRAPTEQANGLVSFAASKGYAFTAEGLASFAKAAVDGKHLTDAELDGVAGGSIPDSWRSQINESNFAFESILLPVNSSDRTGRGD